MRSFALFLSMIFLCGLAPRAAANGTIDIQTTAFDNYVVVDVTVVDTGGGGSCNGFFTLRRKGVADCSTTDIATFARQPGTTSTQQFYDAPLYPSRAYRYEVVSCSGYAWAFDCGWGLPIEVVATTTPAPAFLGHGRLAAGVTFYSCPDLCASGDVINLPPDGWQYVGTGIDVLLFGNFLPSCQNGWLYNVTRVVPSPCTVAVGPHTWSGAKSLYR